MNIGKPEVNWQTKVPVELSLEEMAVIRSVLGPLSTGAIKQRLDDEDITGIEMLSDCSERDLPYHLYSTLNKTLKEYGMI